MNGWRIAAAALLALVGLPAMAADYPAPRQGEWIARDFRFHTGEVLPAVRLHYRTVGAPTGMPVLLLHASTGSGEAMLSAGFAGELFGPGQPLDATKYFVILPAAFGGIYPWLSRLDLLRLHSPTTAVLAAVAFNALVIVGLVPMAMKGVAYRPRPAAELLRTNLLVWGLGGLLLPFPCIKAIDLLLATLGVS